MLPKPKQAKEQFILVYPYHRLQLIMLHKCRSQVAERTLPVASVTFPDRCWAGHTNRRRGGKQVCVSGTQEHLHFSLTQSHFCLLLVICFSSRKVWFLHFGTSEAFKRSFKGHAQYLGYAWDDSSGMRALNTTARLCRKAKLISGTQVTQLTQERRQLRFSVEGIQQESHTASDSIAFLFLNCKSREQVCTVCHAHEFPQLKTER